MKCEDERDKILSEYFYAGIIEKEIELTSSDQDDE